MKHNHIVLKKKVKYISKKGIYKKYVLIISFVVYNFSCFI